MATVMSEYRAERDRLQVTNGHRERETRTPILVVLAGVLATVARFAARRLPRWSQIRTAVMAVAGLGCVVVGAFHLATWAGWVALGLSFLVAEVLTGPSET